jgi:hypothetical protein
MTKYAYLILLFTFCSGLVFAQKADVNNFIVKESLLKDSKLAIIAADSLEQPLPFINGMYTFTASGFSQPVTFHDGIAILPLPIERSTFVYLKHENENGTHSKLLYVYKKDGSLNPYTINILWLILFPAIIVLLAFAFRKFIIAAIIILLVFIYFNHSNGLSISTFFETLFDGLKDLF